MENRLCGAIAALALVTVLAGCSPEGKGAEWTTPEIDESVRPASASTTLPFDAYHLSASELGALQLAKASALTDCAGDYGAAVGYGGDYIRPEDGTVQWGGPFGTLDEAHASKFGYQAAPEGSWTPLGGFYIRQVSNMHPNIPAYADEAESLLIQEVSYGPQESSQGAQASEPDVSVPPGGCIQVVESRYSTKLVSIADVESELMNLALSHRRVQIAVNDWSQCMKEEVGEEFTSVQDAVERFALSDPSEAEIEVALADVKCTASSRWADFYYAVLVEYQEQAIAANPDLFESVLASERSQMNDPASQN
jgi:hypothetical protein